MIFENVIFPDSEGFRCKNCGVCCRIQPPDLNKAEQKKIEARGFKNFLAHSDETGIAWIRRKKDASCFFLSNNKCTIYDIRPAICRLEPFTIGDYDFSKNQIELVLNFPFTSYCAGFCCVEELPVEEIAEAAQTMLQKILDLTARDLGLPITDKRVHREARSRLLRRTVEMADLQI